jgi:hypothetical protein
VVSGQLSVEETTRNIGPLTIDRFATGFAKLEIQSREAGRKIIAQRSSAGQVWFKDSSPFRGGTVVSEERTANSGFFKTQRVTQPG